MYDSKNWIQHFIFWNSQYAFIFFRLVRKCTRDEYHERLEIRCKSGRVRFRRESLNNEWNTMRSLSQTNWTNIAQSETELLYLWQRRSNPYQRTAPTTRHTIRMTHSEFRLRCRDFQHSAILTQVNLIVHSSKVFRTWRIKIYPNQFDFCTIETFTKFISKKEIQLLRNRVIFIGKTNPRNCLHHNEENIILFDFVLFSSLLIHTLFIFCDSVIVCVCIVHSFTWQVYFRMLSSFWLQFSRSRSMAEGQCNISQKSERHTTSSFILRRSEIIHFHCL